MKKSEELRADVLGMVKHLEYGPTTWLEQIAVILVEILDELEKINEGRDETKARGE